MNHPEEVFGILSEVLAFINRGIFRLGMIRAVRSIRRDVSIKWALRRHFAFNPRRRLLKEFVGTIALGLHKLAIMQKRRSVIGITGDVATASRIMLTDTTGAMDINLIEAPLIRLILSLVAEVPLAEDTRAITCLLELLGQCHRRERHPLPLQDRMGDTILEFMPASQ